MAKPIVNVVYDQRFKEYIAILGDYEGHGDTEANAVAALYEGLEYSQIEDRHFE